MPASLLLPGKSSLSDVAVLDIAFHAGRAVERSFVMHFSINIGHLEGEFDLVALNRPRERRLAEHSGIGAGQLFAILLEFERRAAPALGSLDGEFPDPRNISGERGAQERGRDHGSIESAA